MCACVRETEERGTDWYIEGKDAAGETSESDIRRVQQFGHNKQGENTVKKKNRRTTNTLSDKIK